MRWLWRYARRHRAVRGVDAAADAQVLRRHFTPAAWRLICRSGKAAFLPILRHRGLGWTDLVRYAEQLASTGWTVPPGWQVLSFLLQQEYAYFNRPASIPDDEEDYTLMWICQREAVSCMASMALVTNWSDQTGFVIQRHHAWAALLRRARQWKTEQAVMARHAASPPWHFFCDRLDWRGLEIVPLRTAIDLWEEGIAMHSCLYKLRYLCTRTAKASRFFSVRRHGKRLATLELTHREPHRDCLGMTRVTGVWQLLDCRLAFNRLPDAALIDSLQAFAWQYTVWSCRPSRQPPKATAALSRPVNPPTRRYA